MQGTITQNQLQEPSKAGDREPNRGRKREARRERVSQRAGVKTAPKPRTPPDPRSLLERQLSLTPPVWSEAHMYTTLESVLPQLQTLIRVKARSLFSESQNAQRRRKLPVEDAQPITRLRLDWSPPSSWWGGLPEELLCLSVAHLLHNNGVQLTEGVYVERQRLVLHIDPRPAPAPVEAETAV